MSNVRKGVRGFTRAAALVVLLGAGLVALVVLGSTTPSSPGRVDEALVAFGEPAEPYGAQVWATEAIEPEGALDLAGAVAMAAGDEYWATTAAHVSGAAGTNWRTDLEVHNPGGVQASYTIYLLKRDTNNASPQQASYSLGAGQAARYNDLFSTLFGYNGGGALRVVCTGGSIMVTSRTYNDQPGGTFGQFVRGRPLGEGIAYGETGRMIQLTHNRDTSSGYRTNLLFVNATASTLQFVADFYAASGAYLGQQQRTLNPYEYKQIDKAFEAVTGGDVADGYIVVSTTTPGGRFFAGCSVIDNRTGDAVFVPHERTTGGGGTTTTTAGSTTTTAGSTTTTVFTTTTTVASTTTTVPGGPSYGPLVFATVINESTGVPTNPGTVFAYGATRLYALWNYSGVVAGSGFTVNWYRNGTLYSTGGSTWPGSSGSLWNYLYKSSGQPLDEATYRFDLVVSGSVVLTGQCVIGSGGGTTTTTAGSSTTTTSINAGTGTLAFRLLWNDTNDLDLHVIEPNATHIYYSNTGPTATGGRLDVDCNAGCNSAKMCGTPTENIFWASAAPTGTYEFWIDWYQTCGPSSSNFTLYVYVNGAIVRTITGTLNSADSQHYTHVQGGGSTTTTSTGGGGTNLQMVTPTGWASCVVCNYRELNPPVYEFLSVYYTTHVYWGFANTGSNTATGPIKFGFYLDGVHFFDINYSNSGGMAPGSGLAIHYGLNTGSYINVGTHNFGIKVDQDNAFAETNEGDNTCSRSFEWTNIVFSPPDGLNASGGLPGMPVLVPVEKPFGAPEVQLLDVHPFTVELEK